MKRFLRIAAAVLCATIVLWWAAAGMNPGWTKTSVATMETDPITGIDYPVWKKHFVPGIDLLATGIGCAAAIVAISFLPIFPGTHKKQHP